MKRILITAITALLQLICSLPARAQHRERINLNEGWKFYRYATVQEADSLIYDVRPEVIAEKDGKAADSKPTEAVAVTSNRHVLKPWILPTGNAFIKDPGKRYTRPAGDPGSDFPFVQAGFNDQSWENVNLPHDWAIKGPFYKGWGTPIGGGMGRLPSQGVAWYRKALKIPASDAGKTMILEIEGAMSYAMVWLNGQLVGGWPYGYTSWQVDLTPYIMPGKTNQLAIRVDNPASSSRWYPGGGIYRDVWLTKTNPVHVAQWGSFITTRQASASTATLDLKIILENTMAYPNPVALYTSIYGMAPNGKRTGKPVARVQPANVHLAAHATDTITSTVTITNPKLWGPAPEQTPHRYIAVTTVIQKGKMIDEYETPFGIRTLRFDANNGFFVNNKRVYIQGANQHHDLGALGAAFNVRAAERQLEMLRDMGCNAIRMSHNPPSPALLELTDRMGFLVIDEIFDCWELKKNPHDFHLVFPDWHEQDLRALIRRDRNHPSVIIWSFGNEVGEQYTDQAGGAVAKRLKAIVKDEDTTRPTTIGMNYAKPYMPLPDIAEVISLNYQGEGIRNSEAYAGLKGITTPPLFPAFHEKFPGKLILSTENASALSSREAYLFPVYKGNSAPVKQGQGGDSMIQQVSAYELYSVEFGASADKVFASMDKHPYVAGGFVWTGWDYLGEPTPYYLARSSYSGIIDLAGFKKDRFYIYQSKWRPELPMAHLLPHWTWPDRIGQVTPVHVFTSGDEAELFLNGRSLGRKKLAPYEYRLRWDEVTYTPGELKVVAYKNGKKWAEDQVITAGDASNLQLKADRTLIKADGKDLSFVTINITDKNGHWVPQAHHTVRCSITGPGEIIATDNGDATNLVSFASPEREAFHGRCLVIIRAKKGQPGKMQLTVTANGLTTASLALQTEKP